MCWLRSGELKRGDEDGGMCLGFAFAARLGFLGGTRLPLILKDAACSSAADQGFRHRCACGHQPASCPRHLPAVALTQDPSCPVSNQPNSSTFLPRPPLQPHLLDLERWWSWLRCSWGPWAAPEWWLVKEGLPRELVVGLAMLMATCRCGASAGGAHWDNWHVVLRGPEGDWEADVLSHGGAGVAEPSSIMAGIPW